MDRGLKAPHEKGSRLKHTADGKLVIVFEGACQDAAFLASLLPGSGIEAVLDSVIGENLEGAERRPHRVLVHPSAVDRASPLVRDFEHNGKKREG
jgi:hypothetical protein